MRDLFPHRRGRSPRLARGTAHYLAGLDVGTSMVEAVVAEVLDDGGLALVGAGLSESDGFRGGVVTDRTALAASIWVAARDAAQMADVRVGSIVLAISGPHIQGMNGHGAVGVRGRDRVVTDDDARRAIDAAGAVALPAGRETLIAS